MSQITIVGLGPGAPRFLTREAQDVLFGAAEVFLRNSQHPVVGDLPRRVSIVSFDDLPATEPPSPSVSATIARRLVAHAEQAGSAIYAVPGDPSVGDRSVRAVLDLAGQREIDVRIVAGISVLDEVLHSLRVDPFEPGLQIVDASEYAAQHGARPGGPGFDPFRGAGIGFDPTRPTLFVHVDGPTVARALGHALSSVYPASTSVAVVIMDDRAANPVARDVPVDSLPGAVSEQRVLAVYISPLDRLQDVTEFDTLRHIVARLRAPDGCPWDREQTHESMKKHLIEETYEAIAALDEGDVPKFAEELGDVLLQVVMHAQLGTEAGTFDLEDVLRAVDEKLIRRHPHVFGDVKVASSAEVLRNWEKIKRSETTTNQSSFSNIPQSIPALMRADAVQSRATRYGWTPPTGGLDLSGLGDPSIGESEFRTRLGEILFDLVALARQHAVDPEEALRLATNHFAARLERALESLHAADSSFDALPVEVRRQRIRQALQNSVM